MHEHFTRWLRRLSVVVGCLMSLVSLEAFAQLGMVHEYQKDGLSFSIMLPEDWDVTKDSGGFEIFGEPKVKKQPTSENPIVADPNITVTASRNPMPIDEKSLETYSAQIFGGLQKVVGENAGLEVFMKKVVDVNEGRKGLLYYVRYKKGKFDVFNAILVVSSATHLFRVTLTDYEVSFDANLERYFSFMSSINVGSTSMVRPTPLEAATPWIAGALGVIVLLFGARMVMHWLAQSRLSHDLSDSISEQSYSSVPLSRPVDFKNSAVRSEFDPEFRQDSAMSRFNGDGEMTEVPLSQAMGTESGSRGSEGRRSVTDPESEFGGFSAAPSAAAPSAARSRALSGSGASKAPARTQASRAVSEAPSGFRSQSPARGQGGRNNGGGADLSKAERSSSSQGRGSSDAAPPTEMSSPNTSFGFSRGPDDDDV